MIIRNFQWKNNKETKNKTTVPGTHPSNTKQCKMLQNFEQRVGMYERGLYFRVPTNNMQFFFFFPFIFISWRLITLQYCSSFCHTLTWISHGFTCIPHPDPPSHLPLHPIPLGLPSAPGPSTCLMLSFFFSSFAGIERILRCCCLFFFLNLLICWIALNWIFKC